MNEPLIEDIKLITVFEDLPVGAILVNENGRIIIANKTFLNIITYAKEEITGKAIGAILYLPTKEKYLNFHSLFNEKSSTNKQIAEIKNKNGKVYQIEFSFYNSDNAHKKFYAGFIAGNQEVKETRDKSNKQVKPKDSIKDEMDQKNELSDLKSRFLSIASHEFRTPLAGIMSSLNLINRYLEADQQAWFQFKNREKVTNHFSKISESVKNLTTILNKFLALGNIEKGEIPIKLVKFSLVRALKLQKSQFQELCKPGQKITYHHHGQNSMVYLDKYLLKNIMNNLFSNAIKFSPENTEIKLYTKVTPDNIQIEIADKGIGIPEADQNKIFRRFYRANNALTYQDGTGLGLNIVKRYVELMNGSIHFESEENMGTTFYIKFPNTKT